MPNRPTKSAKSHAPKPKAVPSYRQRPGYDQAIVTLSDSVTKKRRDFWLGQYDSSESRENYRRLIAEWEDRGRRWPQPVSRRDFDACTFNELALEYWKFAQGYYGANAVAHISAVIKLTRHFFGAQPVTNFGPNALRLIRDAMINGDASLAPPRKPWSRPYINSQIHRLCRMFKWGASHEMLSIDIYSALKSVTGLRRGKTLAAEPPPVRPVAIETVNAIRPNLSRQVAALVDLQLLTGARGGELFKLRPIDLHIDERGGVWTITLDEHKTAHHGHRRTIHIGPRAQNVIRPFLAGRPIDAFLFSPAEADAERRAARAQTRSTPLYCGNSPGTNRVPNPRRKPGAFYAASSYCRAIAYACDRTFPPPEHLRPRIGEDGRRETRREFRARLTADEQRELANWSKEHRWHPHQLRHTAATLIRREFGLEAARIAMGHSSALVTDAVYAERDMQKAAEVMKKIG